ncbi:MAG: hypothetical protein S4CHLAM7_12880 [Chlamydiae bacterium]|nr:hypothetical protein [Chlamydiota bacterium]
MNDSLKMFDAPRVMSPPKQKVPGWVRWPLRILAYPIMILDVYSQKFVYLLFKPKYKIEGDCKQRGNCCHFIHMGWPKKGKLSLFSKLYIFWQTEILGFYFRSFDFIEDEELTRVMSCRYLGSNGKCNHYGLRPGICRDWPKTHLLRKPHLLKGCGFKVVLRKKNKL